MIKIPLISSASHKTRTACPIMRMILKKMRMRTMMNSKTTRWTCATLITMSSSWMREIQNAWIKFSSLSISFIKWTQRLRIVFLILTICLVHLVTLRRYQELSKWSEMTWWRNYTNTSLRMATIHLLMAMVHSPIFNLISFIPRISSFSCSIKSTT